MTYVDYSLGWWEGPAVTRWGHHQHLPPEIATRLDLLGQEVEKRRAAHLYAARVRERFCCELADQGIWQNEIAAAARLSTSQLSRLVIQHRIREGTD